MTPKIRRTMDMKIRFKTDQAIFNFVKTRLLQQGRKSLTKIGAFPGTSCAYRGKDGTRCAVGWLITNDNYKSEFEGAGVYDVIAALQASGVQVIVDSTTYQLLRNLQDVHDSQKPSRWPGAFRRFRFDAHGNYTGKHGQSEAEPNVV